MLVDDSELGRAALGIHLTQTGFDVVGQVGDGRAGIVLAADLRPDVAVIDMEMPDLDGVETTRQMKAVSPATTIILFSSHEAEELPRLAAEAGADAYLLKSSARSMDTLAALIPALTPSLV